MRIQVKDDDKEEAMESLKRFVKPGDTVYTVLRHRSASGMLRAIDLYVIKDNEPLRLSWSAAILTGRTYSRKYEAVMVSGCGMDMGYDLVYSLSWAMFKDSFLCLGKGCPSNDHNNGDSNYSPDHKHSDAGYALKHRWI